MAAIIALSACDTGQPDMPADDNEVMLTLRLSLPETERDAATRAITSVEENAIDIAQLKVLVFKAAGTTETFSYERRKCCCKAEVYGNLEAEPHRREVPARRHSQCGKETARHTGEHL